MIIYPAIDLYDGKAVRLFKGDYAQMTVYSDNPPEIAEAFIKAGARRIHTVDLEGAKEGSTPNFDTVLAIKAAADAAASLADGSRAFVEIGGGIRDDETVAKYLDAGALENGLILDIRAAQILQATGIDVGLLNVGEEYAPDQEYFPDKKRYVGTYGFTATDITVRESAKIHSVLEGGERESIGSYSYENAAGQKFLVFAFDMYRALYEIKGGAIYEHAMKQYARGEQIEAFITSLGKKLPASMKGNPGCYMLCKEGKTGKSVWIGNFFADECMNTTVILDKEYSNIEFINCSGRLVGNRVELDRIGPFSYLGFSVS
jgi:hypothetical protein